MGDAIRSMTPEDLAANREMVRDLNELIRERIGGGDPDAREFLAKHGRFFPGAQTFDDIIDQLAERMAAMQSLLRSMSPEQRAELESMMDALLRDDRLLLDLAQLASNLDLLLPGGLGERVRFSGDEPLSLDGALAQIARLQSMERLEDAAHGRRGARRPRLDRPRRGPRPARRRRGPRPRRPRRPRPTARGGRLPDPRRRAARADAARHAGGSASRCSTTCSRGSSATRSAGTASTAPGRGGERDETTKPYEFGDPFHLDLRGTLSNALVRDENAPAARAARASGRPPARPTTSRSTGPSS